jgi:6-phosphogluconolactonase
MINRLIRCIRIRTVLVMATVTLSLGLVPRGLQAQRRSGAVYVLTNQSTGNSVMVFSRTDDGTLSLSGTFSTGGQGMGTGADPLGSQGALVLGPGRRLLFAVNAGSNEISEFAAQGINLRLLDKKPSGGVMPLSIAVHGWLVYVLNAGGTPDVSGFIIDPFSNRLLPLPGSTRSLPGGNSAAPAQVGFSRDGSILMVTEKGTSKIDTYRVGDDGLLLSPTSTASIGATPFGFGFAHRGIAVVSEAGPNALSSYEIDRSGDVEILSGSIPNGQKATCWAVVTEDGRYAYSASAGTATISSYSLSREGFLSLLNPTAGAMATGSAPTDMALSDDSRFLYVRDGGKNTVAGFRVESGGSLTPVGSVSGIPAGAQGIAAN